MVIGAPLALACVPAGCATAAAAPVGGRFEVRHVFVLVLENESAAVPPRITGGSAGVSGTRKAGRVRLTLGWKVSTTGGTPLAASRLQERVDGAWRMIPTHTTRSRYTFIGSTGQTYRFRVRAFNVAGQASRWSPSSASGTATPQS